ncbi:hypothetical protein P261_00647 [Lachnospiraceae bacterium TWA4]|nr:hypothetical protein P261_00647 [Lachnospiraceae bacterium TWA4]
MEFDYAKDNLEKQPYDHYIKAFAESDPLEIANRCQIEFNEETREFKLRLMGKEYYISHPDFKIRKVDESDNSYHVMFEFYKAEILALRFMLEGKKIESTGEFVTFRDTPEGNMYFKSFQGRCLFRLKYGFGFKLDKFKAAMEKMGATPMKMGDVAYKFEILDDFNVFILWEGDDEFEPSSQILFSDNFPVAFKSEDLVVSGDISITNLKGVASQL